MKPQSLDEIRREAANNYAALVLEMYRKLRETPEYIDVPDNELLNIAWCFIAASI